MEQEDEGGEPHPEEDVEENQALEEEDEPVQPQNNDPTWSKDPDYQPPSGTVKKTKKVQFLM